MTPSDETIKVQLARIEGKMDMSNLRHDQTDKRLDNHDQRLHRHASDISALQQKEIMREGERKGLSFSGKIIWSVLGLGIGSGGVAALLELLK